MFCNIENFYKILQDYFRPYLSMFVPTIETVNDLDAFLVEEPIEILKSGRFNKVPLITGCNSHEGLMMSPGKFFHNLFS